MTAARARPPIDEVELDGLRDGRLGLGAGLAADLYGQELATYLLGFRAGSAERATNAASTKRGQP